MANRYLVDALPGPGRTVLTGEVAHHLGRVLRVRPGAVLALGDGRGGTVAATVLGNDKSGIAVEVGERFDAPAVRPSLVLAFAMPRGARAEWLFEHGTEVGVAAFQPLWTERSRPAGERGERWQRLVAAAAGQCDRAWLPTIAPPRELHDWLGSPELPNARIVGDGSGSPLEPFVGEAVALLVGPEGGFSSEEQAAIAAARFLARRFGPHILRTETAAVLGAGLLLAGST
jgi:16S rRNA (uracil1498-N3)-methyltransferase